MGTVKQVLAYKTISKPATTFCGVELCETIHVHMPGFRFELDTKGFETFAKVINKAYNTWIKLGKPPLFKIDEDGFTPLAGDFLKGKTPYPNRLEIEEQDIPEIHIHIRNLSLRLPPENFKKYAETFTEASKNAGS